jgi:hypothetical protein
LEAIYDESVVYDKTRKEQFDYAGDVCMVSTPRNESITSSQY